MARPTRLVPASARARMLTTFLVLLAVSTVVSTLALRQILLTRVGERVDAALEQEVDEFRTLAKEGTDPRTGRPFGADVRAVFDVYLQRNVPSAGEDLFTFVDSTPHRTTASAEASRRLVAAVERLASVGRSTRGDVTTAAGDVRYLAVPVVVGGERRGAFAVTADLESEREEVDQAVRVAAGVSLAVLALASLIAFALSGRVLAPLRDLTETARSISETDFTRRIAVGGEDEVAELARTFNAMLDRLESSFAAQRAFVSDAGHELRTPITIIRGHLELIGDDPVERAETFALVEDELDRMGRMVEDLLTLAKAERRESFLRYEAVDLDLLTDELLAKAEALAPRDWSVEAVGAGRFTADRQRLTQAVMNLAHNAAQHTGEGDAIVLGSSIDDARVRLWVRDSGPGVPVAERERIFERFARAGLQRRRSDGAGLGLAIVRAIAIAHGGRVLLDSPPGQGATFTLELPIDPPTSMQEVHPV